MTDDTIVFRELRDETAAELDAALAELPAARENVERLKTAALVAGRKFNAVLGRIRRGQREYDEPSPALARMEVAARRERDEVDGDLSLAKQQLATIEWNVSCLRADVAAIDRVLDPTPPAAWRPPEVVKRPVPGPATVELIQFPPGHVPGEAA